MATTQTLTHADLAQHHGSDTRYRHMLNRRVLFTDGIQHMAEAGGAYWLIDAIASYFGSAKMQKAIDADDRLQWMQFWRLDVTGDSARLTMRADSGEEPAIVQKIGFTDFPLDSIDIWAGYDGHYWTIYLPSEH